MQRSGRQIKPDDNDIIINVQCDELKYKSKMDY